MTKFTIIIDNLTFTCHLSKKHRKNINVRIKSNNNIYISKPKSLSLPALKVYLLSNKDWIITNSQKVNKLSSKRASYISDGQVVIFNKKTDYCKNIDIKKYLEDVLLTYVNLTRSKYDEILSAYKINLPEIKIKKMQGKWGACYVNKEMIYLNINLVHYPKLCIDYVLLHEYLHFIEANHSKNFYNLVKLYMPNYKEAIKYLKTN